MTDIFFEKRPARRLIRSGLTISIPWPHLVLPVGIFMVALLPRILGLSAFLTADEDDQIMFAHLFLKSALQGDWAGALVLGYPGVPTLILGALGVGMRYLFHYQGWLPLSWATADLIPTIDQVTTQFGVFEHPMDFLPWVRTPLALVAALSITAIFLLVRRLLDEPLALLGALIIAFDPFILAHTRVIHVDAPLSYFMFLSFLAFLLYLKRGAWKWLLLSGLFGGLAALSKTPAALLGPILVITGIFYALLPPPGGSRAMQWQRLALALVGWGLLATAVFFALWPSMWTRPLFAVEWIMRSVRDANGMYHPTTGIFWTEQQSDQNPLYYLISLPYHLTPLTTIGVVAGLGMVVAGLAARWRKSLAGNDWLITLTPLALGLIIYVIAFVAPVSYISRRGDRYILPVFFAADLFAVMALWWLVSLLRKYLPRVLPQDFLQTLKLSPLRIIGLAILIQSSFVLLYQPYYLAYYNPLLGGGHTAPYHVNIGWGEGLNLAAQYLNEITEPGEAQVATWYSGQFAPYYHGQTIDLSNQSAALTGDYTVFYINQVQRSFPSREILAYFQQRDPLHVVKLGGIDYAWIYKGPIVSQEPPEGYAFPVEVIFSGGARLMGLDIPQRSLPVDAYAAASINHASIPRVTLDEAPYGLPVTLYWETVGQINGEHNIYIRLVDEDGNAWGQVDRMILAGLWQPDRWHTGYYLRDEYKLPLDPATPPGAYHFEVSMYDFVTGQSYGVAKNIGEITLVAPEDLPQSEELDLEVMLSQPINSSLTLVGHNYLDSQAPPGGEIIGKIFWQANHPLDRDYTLEFSLVAPDRGAEYVVAEMPLSTSYPMPDWRRSEIVGAAYRFRIPAVAPADVYPLSVSVVDPETGERVGQSTPLGMVTVEARERNFELPAGVVPISAVINDEVELLGYKLLDETTARQETFGLNLYWRSLGFAEGNYTVFVHAVGPDQVMRGQWDSVPVEGASPTSGWVPGQVIEDHYDVPMAKDAPPWKYDIFVGLYDAKSNRRLPVFSPHAPTSEDRIWLTRIQVVEK